MSVQAISWALALRRLPSTEKFVLVALCNYANHEGTQCFPGQQRLAEDTGLTDRTVRKVLASLEKRRLITRRQRRRADGYKTSDEITIHFSPEIASGEMQSPDFHDSVTGNSQQPHRNQVPVHIDEPSEEPSENRQIEPIPVEKAFENWNRVAKVNNLPLALNLSQERKKKLKARLSEVGLKGWNEALNNLEEMPFCCGENERGWKVNLDWMLSPTNLMKVLEKQYAREEKPT
jgi:Helix-turn-helix domain